MAQIDDTMEDEQNKTQAVDETSTTNTPSRPRRANAGSGAYRLKMGFDGKLYQSGREFNFVTNRKKTTKRTTDTIKNPYMDIAYGVMFTQMSAKAGFFGERAIATIFKEFKQLYKGATSGNPVVIPIDARTLLSTRKRKALRIVNLIKENQNDNIKGKRCDDGVSH